jgi:hypothetical protein
MKNLLTPILLLSTLMLGHADEATPAEQEHYTETHNCVRVFDWDTLELLMNTKVPKVNINAKSREDLLSQLKKSLEGIKEVKDLRIDFQKGLFDRRRTDGGREEGLLTGERKSNSFSKPFELKLVNVPLSTLIRFVCDSMKMTFSVKKGEIVIRPLIG